VERAREIDGEDPVPVCRRVVLDRPAVVDADAVDEHVEPAELVAGPGHGGARALGIAQVHLSPDGHTLVERRQAVLGDVEHPHGRALFQKSADQGRSERSRAARHENAPALDPEPVRHVGTRRDG
jgi:hypothetical protein